MRKRTLSAALACALLGLSACRGGTATEPPVHIQRGMMTQDKGKPQRENPFFADHRTQRPPVEGTVGVAAPDPTDPVQTGREAEGEHKLLSRMPVPVTMPLLVRGRERYDIYCAPCHDKTGAGNGMVWQRAGGAMVRPPTYHAQNLRDQPDGHFFDVITNGIRTMPSYAHQVPVEDRWAIVAYIRALQRSTGATLADVPDTERSKLQ